MNTPEIKTGAIDPVGEQTLEIISGAGAFNKWMYTTIKPYLKGEILEIGSGIGNISHFAVADNFTITLSDYNFQYYQKLKKAYSAFPNVRNVLQIDLLHPGFEKKYVAHGEQFDTIFLLNVIEHLKDDMTAVRNCQFLLKQGGTLILLAPAYNWLYCDFDRELGHYRRYSTQTLQKPLLQLGFKIIKKQYFNLLGITGWFVFGKILRKKAIGKEMNTFNAIVPIAKCIDTLSFRKAGLSSIVIGKKL